MDIEREITKKHIIIGIASLVFVIGILILVLTAFGNDSDKENLVVKETTTEITSTTITTTETSKTTKTTTTTSTSTTESTSTTSEITTTTTTVATEKVEDIPVINDEPEHVETEKPVVNTTKVSATETVKPATTTAKPVETEKPVTTTEEPVSSSHYYGEIRDYGGDGWSLICGSWNWDDSKQTWIFGTGFTGYDAAAWVRNTNYMKPSYTGSTGEYAMVNCFVWLQ